MVRVLPYSPRRRRRLFRLVVAVWLAGLVALAVVLLPEYSGHTVQHFSPGAPQVVAAERQVPVAAADRRAINRLLDRFIPAAVGRQDPLAAYRLTTPALRASAPRSAWKRGEIAAYPLRIQGSTFHGWTVQYSYRDEVNLELVVHARPGEQFSGVAYTIDVKRLHGRWLVDSIGTRGFYGAEPAPSAAAGRRAAEPARTTPAASALPKSHPLWFIVPLALLGTPGLVLAAWALLAWRRRRAAERRYRLAG